MGFQKFSQLGFVQVVVSSDPDFSAPRLGVWFGYGLPIEPLQERQVGSGLLINPDHSSRTAGRGFRGKALEIEEHLFARSVRYRATNLVGCRSYPTGIQHVCQNARIPHVPGPYAQDMAE